MYLVCFLRIERRVAISCRGSGWRAAPLTDYISECRS
jgi:hypothetical protein